MDDGRSVEWEAVGEGVVMELGSCENLLEPLEYEKWRVDLDSLGYIHSSWDTF